MRHLIIALAGFLVVLLACSATSAYAGAVAKWDFRDGTTTAWQVGGDVAELLRTAEGLVVIPSGVAPTIVISGLAVSAADVAYARLQIRSPIAIDEAYLGWAAARRGQPDARSNRRFAIPRELRGGFPRSVWIRLDEAPEWSGTVQNLGLLIVVGESGQPVVIESIALFPAGLLTQSRAWWEALALDDVAEDLAFPLWSLNTVRPVMVGARTLGSIATGVVCVGLVLLVLTRLKPVRPTLSRALAGTAIGLIVCVAMGLVAVAAYLETRAFRVEWAVFGARSSADDYRYMDGFDLVGTAADLNRALPAGTELAACLWGNPRARDLLSRRVRYELYPLRLTPDATLLLEFDEGKTTCRTPDDQLILSGLGYHVYQRQ
jgi:hypothetical protein